MNWCEGLDRFDLDDQIRSESDVDPNPPVDRWDCLLADRPDSTLSKFIGENSSVNRLP